MPCRTLLVSAGLAKQNSSNRLLIGHYIFLMILVLFPRDHFTVGLLDAAMFNWRFTEQVLNGVYI